MITQKEIRLGKELKQLRKNAGLTQEQLAEKVGVTTKYIQYLEAGKRVPGLKLVYRLAKVLGVKVKDIFPF